MHTNTSINACIQTYTRALSHQEIQACAHTHTYARKHTQTYTHTQTHTHTHAMTHTHIHVHIHTNRLTHTYAHVRAHTNTNTHTQCSFAVEGQSLWNRLPDNVKEDGFIELFKQILKTLVFSKFFRNTDFFKNL